MRVRADERRASSPHKPEPARPAHPSRPIDEPMFDDRALGLGGDHDTQRRPEHEEDAAKIGAHDRVPNSATDNSWTGRDGCPKMPALLKTTSSPAEKLSRVRAMGARLDVVLSSCDVGRDGPVGGRGGEFGRDGLSPRAASRSTTRDPGTFGYESPYPPALPMAAATAPFTSTTLSRKTAAWAWPPSRFRVGAPGTARRKNPTPSRARAVFDRRTKARHRPRQA